MSLCVRDHLACVDRFRLSDEIVQLPPLSNDELVDHDPALLLPDVVLGTLEWEVAGVDVAISFVG